MNDNIDSFVWRMLSAMARLMDAEQALYRAQEAMTPDEFKQISESLSLALNQCRIMLDLVKATQ